MARPEPNTIDDALRKRAATTQAKLAMRAYVFSVTSNTDGRTVYLVSRWGLAKEFDSLAEVERFCEQLGAS